MKTNTIQHTKTGRDTNGNKTVKVQCVDGSFTLQTLGNLPKTHRDGIGPWTAKEINAFISLYGTERQKKLLDIGNSLND